MVTRKRRLLLAVVAVSATGAALPGCSDGTPQVCHGFTVNAAACGNAVSGIDAGVGDGPQDDGSATDAHVSNDAAKD